MKSIALLLFLNTCFTIQAQKRVHITAVKHHIDSVNRLIDKAVINKQYSILHKHYASDYYHTHASGKIDTKKSWIENVKKPSTSYTLRNHDSVTVELHKDIAIVTGTLEVDRPAGRKKAKYVRVFVYRQKLWQLLSHNAIYEWETKAPLNLPATVKG